MDQGAGSTRDAGARHPSLRIWEGEGCFEISFHPYDVAPLAGALHRAGRPVNGYTVEAVVLHLSEKGGPEWSAELEFDSEADTFCVRCRRRGPLEHVIRRLQKRLVDRAAMRRLVGATPPGLGEG